MDFALYQLLNGYSYRHDAMEDPLRFFALDAQFFFVALLAVVFLTSGRWRSVNGRHGVVAAGFSAALALGFAHIGAYLWDRPRPYVAHADSAHLLIQASPDPSFPSDHATAAFAIAVALALRHRKVGVVALAMASVLCLARVSVGTHYPSDVVVGALFGSVAAMVFWHPRVRGRLHGLADWSGSIYETTLDRLLRRPRQSAA
jgi:undecaprenyl-diphosphatase